MDPSKEFLVSLIWFQGGKNIVACGSLESFILNSENTEIDDDKITVLSFWATWCVPCINELDAISDIYEEWQEDLNVEVIAVSTDDSRTQKRIRPMINGKGWEYKILLDKNNDLKRALNIIYNLNNSLISIKKFFRAIFIKIWIY